ncbi:tetraspanin-15-like [Apostichopus japonicus]|uniref:tetraspanin-15-like n=1 Tax=Stichopus japonicus TaxID=307972 RepID=UPI003AB894C6
MAVSFPSPPSCGHACLRVALVIYMIFFWLIGAAILSVGIYAEVSKWDYEGVTNVLLSPSSVMIAIGGFMFILNFLGWIGALRENVTLLKIFGWTLLVVFFLQLFGALLAIVFSTQTRRIVDTTIQRNVRLYYDDPDIHFALDSLQTEFECCGGADYNDWDLNIYYDCDGRAVTACGVPYSCCTPSLDPVVNTQCGYKVREGDHHPLTLQDDIFIRGCTSALAVWIQDNLKLMMGLLLGLCVPQLIGCGMTFKFIIQVEQEIMLYNYQVAPTEYNAEEYSD